MTGTPILLLAGILTAAAPQEPATPQFEFVRFTPSFPGAQAGPSLSPVTVTASPAASAHASATAPAVVAGSAEKEQDEDGLTWTEVAHRLGGAVVGGWLGYVGAQVVKSDWDKETNSSFRDQRSTWTAAGAVIGVISSHLFGTTEAPHPGNIPVNRPSRDGSYLGLAEIREADARNAYELIYNTRMQWLNTRGVNSVAESPRGQGTGDFQIRVTPGREKIIVYMDDIRLGGVDTMREIPTDILTSARFLDTREATLRFGGGHAHGAILLSTEVQY